MVILKNDILNIVSNVWVAKFLIFTGVCCFSDFITGYVKAWRSHNVKSAKLKDGLAKLVLYFVFIMICFFFDFLIGKPAVIYFGTLSVSLIELKSIDENIKETGLSLKIIIDKIKEISEKRN